MPFKRLLLLAQSAGLLLVGCEKQTEAPVAQVVPEASSIKPKPEFPPPPPSAPVFTLKDFDSNSTDHNATRKAIGSALGKSPADLTQDDLTKVEKLDLFGAGITDISPVAALTGLKRLNIFGNMNGKSMALALIYKLE